MLPAIPKSIPLVSVNEHVFTQIKRSTSFTASPTSSDASSYMRDLVQFIFAKDSKGNKKNKNSKQQLSMLRELCAYMTTQMVLNEEFVDLLLCTIIESPDGDVDKKIFRTATFLLTEYIHRSTFNYLPFKLPTSSSALNQLTLAKMVSAFTDELKVYTGVRECFDWMTLGTLTPYGRLNAISASAISQQSELEEYCIKTFAELKYPSKPHKSILGENFLYLLPVPIYP